ncbi:MAG: beta-ketoacyl synthase N-terminal-like domain-containing protein [Bacteroidota bacterium]
MFKPIAITAIASVSPIGMSVDEIWSHYLEPHHFITKKDFGTFTALAASLSEKTKSAMADFALHPKYKNLDPSVWYAMAASRNAVQKAGWKATDHFGINIGSSRGATALFERYHKNFLNHNTTETLASPTTTLGNISSWVAHDLQTDGPEISHSITCSTALHALLNGLAWIQSGMTDKFLVGGSEAALTPFTIAQMQALRIYATDNWLPSPDAYPCRSFDLAKSQNTMVLGEGAGIACIEKAPSPNTLAYIVGIGYATEVLAHSVSISAGASCLQKSMTMALSGMDPDDVDAVVMHAPGTIKGDQSEYNAIKQVFDQRLPALTTNKWKIGHTFGASGMLSVELAVLMLNYQHFIPVPFLPVQHTPEKLEHILVNAVGFGGNAVSVLLKR